MQISQADAPEIPADDPFSNDELEREPVADFLTNMLTTIDEPFVISLTAPWGTGKTTLIEMWKQKLENKDHPSLYFNAWDNDFVDDPLVAFVGELDERISEQTGFDIQNLKDLGTKLARRSIPVALRLASAGLIDDKTFQAAAGDEIAKGAEDLFDAYLQEKELVSDFRDELENFAGQITEEKGSPLFFFVDELDRCRPDFALELLERIKHLFDVPGIAFILVVDPDQLRHSVKSLYGRGMDARGYLHRFVDLEYELPDPEPGAFARFLYKAHNLEEIIGEKQGPRVCEVAIWCCEEFEFSLRSQKQYFMRLELVSRVLKQHSDWHFVPWKFLALLVALRRGKPGLYDDLRSEKEKKEEAKALIDQLENGLKEFGIGASTREDVEQLHAAVKVAYWTDREDYLEYKEEVGRKREELKEEGEIFHGHPKQKEMSRVSTFHDLGVHFEQELIEMIELANPAE